MSCAEPALPKCSSSCCLAGRAAAAAAAAASAVCACLPPPGGTWRWSMCRRMTASTRPCQSRRRQSSRRRRRLRVTRTERAREGRIVIVAGRRMARGAGMTRVVVGCAPLARERLAPPEASGRRLGWLLGFSNSGNVGCACVRLVQGVDAIASTLSSRHSTRPAFYRHWPARGQRAAPSPSSSLSALATS